MFVGMNLALSDIPRHARTRHATRDMDMTPVAVIIAKLGRVNSPEQAA